MSFLYGRSLKNPIRIENGRAFFPVCGPNGEGEVIVRPDEGAVQFLNDFASADGEDVFLKRLLPAWFVRNQASIEELGVVYWVTRRDLEDAEASLN